MICVLMQIPFDSTEIACTHICASVHTQMKNTADFRRRATSKKSYIFIKAGLQKAMMWDTREIVGFLCPTCARPFHHVTIGSWREISHIYHSSGINNIDYIVE